ncbi:MAG TPA: hypothetical protein VFL70_05335 [Bacteroidia bacterium]|nr:hypothetical protein [Bacteroidia bacterium]HNO70421.1 hypothetical protein [Bacteroidia bacterium]
MKKLFHLSKIFVVLSIAAFSAVESNAQCKGFVKKQIPKLAPFIHNGQINTSVLLAGDHAELTLTFYSGQTYRIMVDSQETLGDVFFLLKDANKNQVFSSKDQGKSDYWDFTVESTQQLTVEVEVPDTEAPNGIVPSGCVSILVGFRQ